MKLLELLDHLNDTLVAQGKEPIAFESDCREGICGTWASPSMDARTGGRCPTPPHADSTYGTSKTCRRCTWNRSGPPPTRSARPHRRPFRMDRVIEAGGFVSVDAGTAPDADTAQIPLHVAEAALDFAACIGCGACVAACPNGSGSLFTGAKLGHLSLLPHGRQERERRAQSMGVQADEEFGHCTLFVRMRASLSGIDPDHCGRRAQPRAAPRLDEAVPGAGQRETVKARKRQPRRRMRHGLVRLALATCYLPTEPTRP